MALTSPIKQPSVIIELELLYVTFITMATFNHTFSTLALNRCFRTMDPQVLSKPAGFLLTQISCISNGNPCGCFDFMTSDSCNQKSLKFTN